MFFKTRRDNGTKISEVTLQVQTFEEIPEGVGLLGFRV